LGLGASETCWINKNGSKLSSHDWLNIINLYWPEALRLSESASNHDRNKSDIVGADVSLEVGYVQGYVHLAI
jgi:hypothetical protein